jgi:hypothetical protein
VAKKWYSYFVVTDDTPAAAPASSAATAPTPAPPPRRADDLAPEASAPPPPPVAAVGPSADLAIVYDAAKIAPPPHGYTVLKVAEMLHSEHIHALPQDVRRKSVLVALDAAGVKVDEIVEDAVRRDRALDTYERVLQQHLDQLAAKTEAENQALEEEIARRAAELRARIDENRRVLDEERREFQAWKARKDAEESLIADAVGYFVSENPVSTRPSGAAAKEGGDVR